MSYHSKIMTIALQYTITTFETSLHCRTIWIELDNINSSFAEALRRFCMVLINTASYCEAASFKFFVCIWIYELLFNQCDRNLDLFFNEMEDTISSS